MKVKKVGIIKGQSQYDVMRSWCLELEKGFNKLGIETIVYDMKYHNTFNNYNDIDFYIAFNGWAVGYQDQLNFKSPVIMILADHVIDHLDRIKSLRSHDILTIMDKYDNEILNLLGIQKDVYFLPHAALEVSYGEFEKEIDCLFLGSYSDPYLYLEKLKSITSPILSKKFEEILKDCMKNPQLNHIEHSLRKFNQLNVIISAEDNIVLLEFIRVLGRYIYSIRRLEVLKILADNNIHIHVRGNGWESSNIYKHHNITFGKFINFFESQKLIKKSKVLLNVQSFLVDGAHERVFSAMANDSVSLSNRTKYLCKEFIEDEEILLYDFNDVQSIIKKLKDIIQDDLLRTSLTEKAKSKISLYHTYQKRAEDIVEFYEQRIKENK